MSRLTIEDGFEYQIKRALKLYISDFETPQEALDSFNEGDHLEQLLTYLWDVTLEYTDVEAILADMVQEEDDQ